jgi:hypothetical protein
MQNHIYSTTQSKLVNIPANYKSTTKHTPTHNITPRKR